MISIRQRPRQIVDHVSNTHSARFGFGAQLSRGIRSDTRRYRLTTTNRTGLSASMPIQFSPDNNDLPNAFQEERDWAAWLEQQEAR